MFVNEFESKNVRARGPSTICRPRKEYASWQFLAKPRGPVVGDRQGVRFQAPLFLFPTPPLMQHMIRDYKRNIK